MKRILLYAALLLFCGSPLAGQTRPIDWGRERTVHDHPITGRDTSGTDPEVRFRRTFGSEYGRMLPLPGGRWLAAYTVSRNDGYRKDPEGGFWLEIAASTDKGRTWKPLATIREEGRDLDNAQMIRLPDGSVLLACRSVRWQESYRLPVYRSADGGRTWEQISTIDANEGVPGALGKPDKGVYEPHLGFGADGRLAVLYASEKHVTDSLPYGQIIAQKVSPDFGRSWGPEQWVTHHPGQPASRPGMPVWTRMKNGQYIVVYEVCGPEHCHVYFKTSPDGYTWPVGLGQPIPEQTGGPYVVSLNDGTLAVISNRGNVSLSRDYGRSWSVAGQPFPHRVDFSKDWTQTIWSSLYPAGRRGLIAMTAVKREGGGHSIRIRSGRIGKGN
ncbi:MAG TPA: sialidase family protein [Chitinophagaceae bacterium]|jgi:hypothetical protein|nr:sialidase family protein [Chitinophagaceae bacterium]